MKKISKILSLLVMFALAIVMVACGGAEVSFDEESVTIKVGQTEELAYTVSDEELELEFSSEDPAIAEVDQAGKVTGVKVGKTTLTVKVKDKKVEDTIEVIVEAAEPTSLTIEDSVTVGEVGEKHTFKAVVVPAGAVQTVTWESSDPEVATVSSAGLVEFVGIGTVKIKAISTVKSSVFKEVEVYVGLPDPASIVVDGVTEVKAGESVEFSANVLPEAAVQEVDWESSNEDIATITEDGLVEFVGVGEVVIKAISKMKETVYGEIKVTVAYSDPTSLSIEGPVVGVIDGSQKYSALVLPATADQSISWESSNEDIATVDASGLVKFLSEGTVTIKAISAVDETVFGEIEIEVRLPLPTLITIDGVTEGLVGETHQYSKTVLPLKANQAVTWESSNEEVATVDSDGLVSFVGVGSAVIKATSVANPELSRGVDITVSAPNPESLTITNNDDVDELEIYEQLQFQVTVQPSSALKTVVWSVSDTELATINNNGILTAQQEGVVIITATSTVDETITAEFVLTITRPLPESVEISGTEKVLALGEEMTLSVVVSPIKALQGVVFTSSDDEVATVDENGLVIAVSGGDVVITVTTLGDETVKATYELTVLDPSTIVYDAKSSILDATITAKRFEKITVDGKDYYVGLNAFVSAKAAFEALVDGSTMIVKAGTYSEEVRITVNNVTILGPNVGKPAGKDLSNRVTEAVFSAKIHLDGVENITIDGIAITGSTQIRSASPVKNILLDNINSYSPSVPAGEGIIYAFSANDTEINENYIVRNSSFIDSTSGGPAGGYRGIRINNAKNIEIYNNYFAGFFDTIRLEGESNAGAGSGSGATGNIIIRDNLFENNFQYPIWIGTYHSANVLVANNYLGTREEYSGVYGYVYIVGYRPMEGVKSVVNVLSNEMPYKVPGWHQMRFNSVGATPEQLEINVHYNIFHENAGYSDGDYYHIADHYAESTAYVDKGFRINGVNNYFLYDEEVLEIYFLNTIYEPYLTELEVDMTHLLVDLDLSLADGELLVYNEVIYQVGLTAFKTLPEALEKMADGVTLTLKDGVYSGAFTISNNNVTILGPNKGIVADKDLTGRGPEAVFTGVITISGVEGLVVDGIAITGSSRFFSNAPVKNLTFENIYAYKNTNDGSVGLLFFSSANSSSINEGITIRNSHFHDTNQNSNRAIRINNAKDLVVEGNYFFQFVDVIRLEGENNSSMPNGLGTTGSLTINDNIFDSTIQYTIWGTNNATAVEINRNTFSAYQDHATITIWAFIYLWNKAPTEPAYVVNIKENEFLTNSLYIDFRFNSNGGTSENMEVNFNYNIFHEAPDEENLHVRNHYVDTELIIDASKNFYLYEGDVLADYFLSANYEPYYRSLDEIE